MKKLKWFIFMNSELSLPMPDYFFASISGMAAIAAMFLFEKGTLILIICNVIMFAVFLLSIIFTHKNAKRAKTVAIKNGFILVRGMLIIGYFVTQAIFIILLTKEFWL